MKIPSLALEISAITCFRPDNSLGLKSMSEMSSVDFLRYAAVTDEPDDVSRLTTAANRSAVTMPGVPYPTDGDIEALMGMGFEGEVTEDSVRRAALALREYMPMAVYLFGYRTESVMEDYRTRQPGILLETLQSPDLRGFIESTFGGWRRALANSVTRTSEARLHVAAHAWGAMPDDWVIDYLRNGPDPCEMLTDGPRLRHLFNTLHPKSLQRILRKPDPLLGDAIDMLVEGGDDAEQLVRTTSFKSARQLHDLLLTLIRVTDEPIIYYSCIEDRQILSRMSRALRGHEFEIVEDSRRAADVGSELSNCLGSKEMRDRGESGQTLFVVGRDPRGERYLLSIKRDTNRITELKRKFNEPDEELREKLQKAVDQSN